jgi:hypothetical protein
MATGVEDEVLADVRGLVATERERCLMYLHALIEGGGFDCKARSARCPPRHR